MPGRRKTPGPFSRDAALLTSDRRTRAGRFFKTVEKEMVDHLGGTPTGPQRLLVQSIALKATRVAMLSDKLLAGGDIAEGSDHHAVSWMNSLRLDLVALGLEKRAEKSPTLADYIDMKATGK